MNILIIGLGSIGKKHVEALLVLNPDITIYAFRRNPVSESYRSVINVQSFEEIPREIDFIIVSNVTNAHADAIMEAAEFGCPVFIEKPVLDNLDKAAVISETLSAKGMISYVACNLRFHPALKFVKEWLDREQPRINEVNIYCGSYLPEWRQGVDFRNVYSAHAEMGGGTHLDLIHEIDYCTWLFGFPEKTVSVKTNRSSLGISAVDCTRFIFTYPSFTAALTLNYYRRDLKRNLEIVTDTDTIVIDLAGNTVKSNISGRTLFQGAFSMLDTYKDQLAYFLLQIQAGVMPENNFDYAVKVLKIVYA